MEWSKNKAIEDLIIEEENYKYYSLSKTASHFNIDLEKIPTSLKILLENVVRNLDLAEGGVEDIKAFKKWQENNHIEYSISKYPARVLMQDFTGVPAIVDLAAMRDGMKKFGKDTSKINPICPVDLIIDHSISVDHYGSSSAKKDNVDIEMSRNKQRYQFLKWGQKAFENYRVVPPGTGICHQVNLEYLAKVVWDKKQDNSHFIYPDTLVGTDSHTPMVNALGVLGWGVGGIEAEAVMLGQPVSLLIPDVVGFYIEGSLREGVTATDMVLTITDNLRRHGVVGKFVEFYGPGVSNLTLAERATISNMSPEFGATCSFFAVDEQTLSYLRLTGRNSVHVDLVACYMRRQGLWHNPEKREHIFTSNLSLDLHEIDPCLAGPKRPQDRVSLAALGLATEKEVLSADSNAVFSKGKNIKGKDFALQHGDVVIAAITSCTNTSNPSVLIAAGLLAKAALAKGLKVKPWVKTSFAPGSKVVVAYLKELGLIDPLEKLGFYLVGYGCTTCIGNSGPLDAGIEDEILKEQLMVSAVLSGNRNFEGRISPYVTMNWLASPPLVVAFAIAGNTRFDLTRDPLGKDQNAASVYLSDIWPDSAEIQGCIAKISESMFIDQYKDVFKGDENWAKIEATEDDLYSWQTGSTYIQKPSFFKDMGLENVGLKDIKGARILALLGDSITTDHISPAGVIKVDSPAGRFLLSKQVSLSEFNSYGSRRGNHEVMIRGTFANVRIRNYMVPGIEGGYTAVDSDEVLPIYDAAMRYKKKNIPLVIFAGKEYGTGSSRDWAAKGTCLLGVKIVIAESFERIHRSNLIGMGVLPCQFIGHSWVSLGLTGKEVINVIGLSDLERVHQHIKIEIVFEGGSSKQIPLLVRIDTMKEMEYYKNGGILQYVLRGLIKGS